MHGFSHLHIKRDIGSMAVTFKCEIVPVRQSYEGVEWDCQVVREWSGIAVVTWCASVDVVLKAPVDHSSRILCALFTSNHCLTSVFWYHYLLRITATSSSTQ